MVTPILTPNPLLFLGYVFSEHILRNFQIAYFHHLFPYPKVSLLTVPPLIGDSDPLIEFSKAIRPAYPLSFPFKEEILVEIAERRFHHSNKMWLRVYHVRGESEIVFTLFLKSFADQVLQDWHYVRIGDTFCCLTARTLSLSNLDLKGA